MGKYALTQKAELRHLAEEQLASRPSTSTALTEVDAQRLIHELQVHQIELEMQNEELQRTRAELETSLQRYSEGYDFAPVGYLLLDHLGVILQANLTGANMLEVHRADLVGWRLGFYVAVADLAVLNAFVAQVFATHTKQACEVALNQAERGEKSNCLFVRLEGSVSVSGRECRVTMIDITERKLAEQAAQESRLRLASITGMAPLGVWEWNVQTGETVFNDAWAQIIGYTLDELAPVSNKTWEAYTHPDDLKLSNELLQRYFANELPYYDCEVRMKHKDGHWVWVHVRGRLITTTTEGEPLLMFGTHIDISARKRVEDVLRVSEERFRTVADFTYDWETWRGPDGEYRYVSPSCERISGHSNAEFMADSTLMLRITHPDDQARLSEHYHATLREARDQHLAVDFRILTSGGETRWINHLCTPVYATDGEWLGRRESNRDITDRKYMEEHLSLLFDAAPDPTVLYDTNFELRDVNNAYESMFGYTRAELIGRHPLDVGIIRADQYERVSIGARDSLLKGQSVPPYEIVLHTKTGDPIDLEVNIHAVTVSGKPGFYASMRDIGARKQAEALLRESNRKLLELIELKTRFVSFASHEFRTPLTTIMFTADMLRAYRSKMDDAKIDIRLRQIISECNHMQGLIDEVLKLTRAQSAGFVLNAVTLDLDAECSEIVDRFQQNLTLAHTLIYTSNAAPLYASVDAKLMKEAITNLISNALKYSSAGTTVGIDLTASDARIVLRVSDQGIGIPADDLRHLFEPFHRAGNVGQIKGTGLGLSITKNAVELHGGTITVESEVGKGTTFTITLPVVV